MKRSLLALTLFVAPLAACGGDDPAETTSGDAATTTSTSTGAGGGGGGGGSDRPPPTADFGRDILSTDLTLDLETLAGSAGILLAPAASLGASFEVGDLTIQGVHDDVGPLLYEVHDGILDVGVPESETPAKLVVDYTFQAHDAFDGWMPASGVTFLWPYFCGNLFPCKSDPADGLTFTLTVTGEPAGTVAVYPTAIGAPAPSYMPAIAVGDYTELDLGTTAQGTAVSVYYLPGGDADATTGTKHLVEVVDFYETTYGPYSFGPKMASVAANWGPGDYGGMEHHPYFHVGMGSMMSEEGHAHEAAHGWFGDGVRIGCWEDFVLSEGTVTYMAAHALESVGVDIWASYDCDLKYACENEATIVKPETCGVIDILTDPLWSLAPYMKGAYFYKEVADLLGADLLDQVLSAFYQDNVGGSAHMDDLLAAIEAVADPADLPALQTLETTWLGEVSCPVDVAALCP